jgi:hypothetical protein
MPEEHPDMMDQMQKFGEKWNEFKKTWVTHFKDMDIEVLEWNFGVGKNDKEYIIDMKAKVAVRKKIQ